MLDKIKQLINSVRFWQITLATLFVVAGHYFSGLEFLLNSLAAWLAAVTAIGTVDSVAVKFGAAIAKK